MSYLGSEPAQRFLVFMSLFGDALKILSGAAFGWPVPLDIAARSHSACLVCFCWYVGLNFATVVWFMLFLFAFSVHKLIYIYIYTLA